MKRRWYKMANVGAVPANNLRQRSDVLVAPNPLPDNFVFPEITKPWAIPISLFRGDDIFGTATASRNFTTAEISGIVDRTLGLYVYAEAQYDDGFGQQRQQNLRQPSLAAQQIHCKC